MLSVSCYTNNKTIDSIIMNYHQNWTKYLLTFTNSKKYFTQIIIICSHNI